MSYLLDGALSQDSVPYGYCQRLFATLHGNAGCLRTKATLSNWNAFYDEAERRAPSLLLARAINLAGNLAVARQTVAPVSSVSVNPSAATTGSALSTNNLPPPSATPPATGRLGVHVTPVTPRIISAFGLPTASGALVLGTISGGSAEKAGFQAGDVIIRISGMQVENPNELASITAKLTPGSTTNVRVWRYRKAMDIAVKISQ